MCMEFRDDPWSNPNRWNRPSATEDAVLEGQALCKRSADRERRRLKGTPTGAPAKSLHTPLARKGWLGRKRDRVSRPQKSPPARVSGKAPGFSRGVAYHFSSPKAPARQER